MKTKNDLKNGILIGIGMIVFPLLLMSTTNYTTEKKNKFEIHHHEDHGQSFLLNTENGDVWEIDGRVKMKLYEDIEYLKKNERPIKK